jgi:hypothetical protein
MIPEEARVREWMGGAGSIYFLNTLKRVNDQG